MKLRITISPTPLRKMKYETVVKMIEEKESDVKYWQRKYNTQPSKYNASQIARANQFLEHYKGEKERRDKLGIKD